MSVKRCTRDPQFGNGMVGELQTAPEGRALCLTIRRGCVCIDVPGAPDWSREDGGVGYLLDMFSCRWTTQVFTAFLGVFER